jgi:RNA methyltransferase, TrmH family
MPPVKTITSRDNPLLVQLRKLTLEPAAYRKLGALWIEGEHLCSAFAQCAGRAHQAVITEAAWQIPALRELANQAAAVVVVHTVLMASLSSLESPPPLGFVVPWAGAPLLRSEVPTLVLDRLQDSGNVGNILRSAAAFGCTQVVGLKGTVALWSPKVLRAAMGAHFGLHVVEGVIAEALVDLRLPLISTSSHAPQVLHELALPWPCAWVLGHEGQGVSAELTQLCAHTVRIPQPGGEESLNVAAAAAVCLYESARQRQA